MESKIGHQGQVGEIRQVNFCRFLHISWLCEVDKSRAKHEQITAVWYAIRLNPYEL